MSTFWLDGPDDQGTDESGGRPDRHRDREQSAERAAAAAQEEATQAGERSRRSRESVLRHPLRTLLHATRRRPRR